MMGEADTLHHRVPRLFILIPVYNEQSTLSACVSRVECAALPDSISRFIVLVDDASTDGAVARITMPRDSVVVCHEVNRGKGAALRSGLEAILSRADVQDDDLILVQDADLEYDPADYPELLAPVIAGRTEVVFGARFGGSRASSGGGLARRIHALGNAGLTLISNVLTGNDLNDMECGYKLFTVRVTRRMLPFLTEDRFGIEPQISAVLARVGCPIEQVAIRYTPRSFNEGKKIKWFDAFWAIWVMFREWVKTMASSSSIGRSTYRD